MRRLRRGYWKRQGRVYPKKKLVINADESQDKRAHLEVFLDTDSGWQGEFI